MEGQNRRWGGCHLLHIGLVRDVARRLLEDDEMQRETVAELVHHLELVKQPIVANERLDLLWGAMLMRMRRCSVMNDRRPALCIAARTAMTAYASTPRSTPTRPMAQPQRRASHQRTNDTRLCEIVVCRAGREADEYIQFREVSFLLLFSEVTE